MENNGVFFLYRENSYEARILRWRSYLRNIELFNLAV
jgi:hypothetical protein